MHLLPPLILFPQVLTPEGGEKFAEIFSITESFTNSPDLKIYLKFFSNHALPTGRKRLWPSSLRWAVSVPLPP